MAQYIPVIVITGGPNGGKTSILEHLEAHFTTQGYQVAVIREVAATLISHGMVPAKNRSVFQKHVFTLSLEEEWNAKRQLHTAEKPLILSDGGIMDGAAYVERESIEKLWDEHGYSSIHLRDERYAGVIHMESASKVDQHILASWVGTPHLAYIDNSTDFDGKIERAIAWAESFVSGKEHERKFSIASPFDPSLLPSHAQCIDIRQSYVREPGASKDHRVRMRGQHGTHAYIKTMKRMIGPMSSDEVETFITKSKYDHLRETYGIPGHEEVVKERWCFVQNGQYWELDVFRDLPGFVLMEAELPRTDWPLTLPSWLGSDVVEVTGLPGYANRDVALAIGRRKHAA